MSASSRSDPSLDLVGRAAEVERLDAVLDPLHHGGEALVFRGEPGIGKSALLKHASRRTASRNRTSASVRVAMVSRVGSSGVSVRSPKPRSLIRKPNPRKMIGNDSGALHDPRGQRRECEHHGDQRECCHQISQDFPPALPEEVSAPVQVSTHDSAATRVRRRPARLCGQGSRDLPSVTPSCLPQPTLSKILSWVCVLPPPPPPALRLLSPTFHGEARLDPSLLALRVVHDANVAHLLQVPGLLPRGFALCRRPGSRSFRRRLMEWGVRSASPLRYVPSLAPFVSCCGPADPLRPFDERLQEAAQPITGLLV